MHGPMNVKLVTDIAIKLVILAPTYMAKFLYFFKADQHYGKERKNVQGRAAHV
jgi:hypothetical protein